MNSKIRNRIEHDLRTAVFRLRRLGGAGALKELIGTIGDGTASVEEGDAIQANESQEIGVLTLELLVDRVNRLAEALDRLDRGEYGICAECGQPIARARLHAIPEARTCVPCQDGLESYRFERDESELRFDARVTLRPPPMAVRLL